MPAIAVTELSKTYVVPEREAGLSDALKSLIHRKTREVKAVDRITFSVEEGEVIGSRYFWKFGLKNYSGASA